jgi:dihydroorotate dehydrogenase (NAD+) catalytic subunit
LGAVVTKSIMMEPRSGRATPRMAETPSGMLNSIGLQGPGIEAFLEKDLSWLTQNNVTTIVSIAGNNVDEFGELARILAKVPGIAGLEVNISCPNVESRGQVFACNPVSAAQVIETVKSVWHSDAPVLAKLSPDVTDIVEIAHSVVEAGVGGVSMINTLLGMVIDVDKMKPMLGGRTGGLSGPAIRPVAVRAIYQVHAALPNLPILGMGGIRTGHDALEFIAAGASAVSIGTVVFGDPGAPWRIATELGQELQARGYDSLREVIGLAHHN